MLKCIIISKENPDLVQEGVNNFLKNNQRITIHQFEYSTTPVTKYNQTNFSVCILYEENE